MVFQTDCDDFSYSFSGDLCTCPFATPEESSLEDEFSPSHFMSFSPALVAEQLTVMDAVRH